MYQRIFRRIAAVGIIFAATAILPKALLASCVTQNYPNGTQTITCCGDTACCTTTWRGSVKIAPDVCT